jgi:hypothetical protein
MGALKALGVVTCSDILQVAGERTFRWGINYRHFDMRGQRAGTMVFKEADIHLSRCLLP